MSNHGNSPMNDQLRSAMRESFGEYPNGRMNEDDAGALPVAIGHDKGTVVIEFPKPVAWIGFTPEQAIEIAQTLITHARACGLKKPMSLTF